MAENMSPVHELCVISITHYENQVFEHISLDNENRPFLNYVDLLFFLHILHLRGEDYFEPEYVHFMNG